MCEGERIVSVLAFADDIAIITKTNNNLQKMMNIISEYCNYYGLSINFDRKDKTVYITNDDASELKITFENELKEIKTLIRISKNECYNILECILI